MILPQRESWRKWSPDGMTFLSALMVVLSFPPWNFWPLIWVSLIPWFRTLRKKNTTQDAVIQGIWISYFITLGGYFWVAFVLREFGGLPWILCILGLQVFCIFGQPQMILFAAIHHSLKNKFKPTDLFQLFYLFIFSFLYCGLDWIIPKLFLDTFGQCFYLAKHLRQLADLGGALLLTFFILFVNIALDQLITQFKTMWPQERKFRLSYSSVACIGLGTLGWTYGYLRYESVVQIVNQSQQGIQMAAIQGNIGDFDKIAAERGVRGAAYKVLDIFTQLSEKALSLTPKPEVIIWPETSYPSTFRSPQSLTETNLDQQIETFVKKLDLPLLFGGYDRKDLKEFNAFFFLSPQGDLQVYRKNILLLFGEYIPGAESIAWLRDTFPQIGNFGRGVGPEVFKLPLNEKMSGKKEIRVSPIICYEALFTDYVAEAARKGSQIILNITNDSWFGEWGEPQLHLALTSFRSIETHLPQFRSTNTGISALITADGEITHATGIGTQEIMNVYVPVTEPIPTLIKKWGNWFGPFSFFIALLGLWMIRLQKKEL